MSLAKGTYNSTVIEALCYNQVFFSTRFGWYIPEIFAKNSPPIKDHWRAFTNPDVTVSFKPSEEDFNYISKMMKQPDGR